MRTPLVYGEGGVDPYAQAAEQHKTTSIEVLFATDRARSDSDVPGERYAARRGTCLLLGSATVEFKSKDESWDALHAATLAQEPLDLEVVASEEFGPLWTTLTVEARDELAQEEMFLPGIKFADALGARLEHCPRKELLIYVHGFNTTHDTTMQQAAQLCHYLARDMPVMLYSWPTRSSVFGYVGDKVESFRSTRNFRELLDFLARQTSLERIHLFSYSAGAPIVTEALLQLCLMHRGEDPDEVKRAQKIHTVIYAAPDQDLQAFKMMALDGIGDLVEVFTLYTNSSDTSFGLGKTFLYRDPRLGRPDEGLTEQDKAGLRELEDSGFVDVSNAESKAGKSGLGHMYWYQNAWVITDLVLGLRSNLPPAERGLVRGAGESVWTFPDDYPERVRAIAHKHWK